MDDVFGAINDASRRRLLDALYERDGQTLTELRELLPAMTRHGVMNHLDVLARAGLVTTHKAGRQKFHYLNPVPIGQVNDRWISKFAAPRVDTLVDLRRRAEKGPAMTRPAHIYETYIRASIDDVWNAIVDPEQTVQYFYGTRVQSDWTVGAPMTYLGADGNAVSEGEIIAIDPPARIEFTFRPLWDPSLTSEGSCREVWSITETNGMSRLTIELFDIAVDGPIHRDFAVGLPYIVAGLKSLLETGRGLPPPG